MSQVQRILSVTQLNRQIRSWLEHEVGNIYVEGEVSTISQPSSGHYYFTLKDAAAQIRCVYFRNKHTHATPTILKAGSQIVIYGQLSLYEARGDYQLIVEQIESAGQGDLFRQFELLKAKLAALGLFESSRKKSIPIYPQAIGVITSSTAAALKDILTTLARRFPLAPVFIYPSEVQGVQAPQQLIAAIQRANHDSRCDVLILARGGGSIEDLWAFNDEQLAYTIANSNIPIVSGVGHETDFTIADFVADLRAATPTAAAEAVSPNQLELNSTLQGLQTRIQHAITRLIEHKHLLLHHELQKLSSPARLIRSHWQTLDYLKQHMISAVQKKFLDKHHHYQMNLIRLKTLNPGIRIMTMKQHLQFLETKLIQLIKQCILQHQQVFETQLATLHAVSPLATLNRGYAIASNQDHVLLNSTQVNVGDIIQVKLAHGQLSCEVTKRAQ